MISMWITFSVQLTVDNPGSLGPDPIQMIEKSGFENMPFQALKELAGIVKFHFS